MNIVNAEVLLRERGIELVEQSRQDRGAFNSVISAQVTTESDTRRAAGTLFGSNMPRLVQIDDHQLEAYLDGVLLVFTHTDVPGIIGRVGTIFGQHHVNIAQMAVGRSEPGGAATGVLNLDGEPPAAALNAVRTAPDIKSAVVIQLPPAGKLARLAAGITTAFGVKSNTRAVAWNLAGIDRPSRMQLPVRPGAFCYRQIRYCRTFCPGFPRFSQGTRFNIARNVTDASLGWRRDGGRDVDDLQSRPSFSRILLADLGAPCRPRFLPTNSLLPRVGRKSFECVAAKPVCVVPQPAVRNQRRPRDFARASQLVVSKANGAGNACCDWMASTAWKTVSKSAGRRECRM